MRFLEIVILTLPFLIEIFGDYYLISKGKKDISSLVRVIAIGSLSFLFASSWMSYIEACIIGVIPFTIFDPALNLLRGRSICYTGKTKMYDLFLAKFPCWVSFAGRVVFIVLLILILIKL